MQNRNSSLLQFQSEQIFRFFSICFKRRLQSLQATMSVSKHQNIVLLLYVFARYTGWESSYIGNKKWMEIPIANLFLTQMKSLHAYLAGSAVTGSYDYLARDGIAMFFKVRAGCALPLAKPSSSSSHLKIYFFLALNYFL